MYIFTAEWVPIVSLIASLFGIPTLIGLVVSDLYRKRKESSEQSKKKKKEEFQNNVREVVQAEVNPIKNDISDLKADFDITKQSIQATLRHELYEIADKWLIKGYCPLQDKEDFENIYKKYHALGKNGVMDDIYTKVMELPISKPRSKARPTKRINHD